MTMRDGPGVRAVLMAALCLAYAPAARAERFGVSTGVFGIDCRSTGQICDPPETLVIGDPAKKLPCSGSSTMRPPRTAAPGAS